MTVLSTLVFPLRKFAVPCHHYPLAAELIPHRLPRVLGLNVIPISGTQLHLTWDANAEPDLNHYNVYRGSTTGFQVNTLTDTPLAQPSSNSYSDTNGLSDSTSYYYRVADSG